MARIGENIQAGLGRVDYSPLAQGIIAGGQARAQGISSAGQSLSSAINFFTKKMEEDARVKKETTFISGPLKENPEIGKILGLTNASGQLDDARVTDAVRTFGAGNVLATGNALLDLKRRNDQIAADRDAIRYAGIVPLLQSEDPAVKKLAEDEAKGFSAQVKFKGEQLYNEGQLTRAQILKTLSDAQGTAPKTTDLQKYINDYLQNIRTTQNREPTPKDRLDAAEKFRASGPSTGDTIEGKRMLEALGTNRKFLDQNITPLLIQQPASQALDKLLGLNVLTGEYDKGKGQPIITGPLANLELGTKELLASFGLYEGEDVAKTQEYIAQLGRRVASIISSFGSGTAISNTDRDYASKIAGGDINMDLKALRRLNSIYRETVVKTIELHNKQVLRDFDVDNPQNVQFIRSLTVPEDEYSYFKIPKKREDGRNPQQGGSTRITVTPDGKIMNELSTPIPLGSGRRP